MRRLPLLVLCGLLGGCFSTHYLGQAAAGQVEILSRARPIPRLLQRRRLPPAVRDVLVRVPSIKAFGGALGLRATANYEQYADLERSAAVWVVQGSAPLAFRPRTWSFPLVGSVPYLGFFDEAAAQQHAEQLAREEGLDTTVRTASAYSTLGWFRDPVLSTMLPHGEHALGVLANTILHESVHATVYVAGQSVFNESLASFVADRTTLLWLVHALGGEARETRAWAEYRVRSRRTSERLHRAWQELAALYASGRSEADKRAQKERVLAQLQRELRTARPLNNASLAGFRTYGSGREAFARLFEACGRSWPAFLAAVGTLQPSDFSAPQQEALDPVIDALAARRCGRAARQG